MSLFKSLTVIVAPILLTTFNEPVKSSEPILSIIGMLLTSPVLEHFNGGTKNIAWLAGLFSPAVPWNAYTGLLALTYMLLWAV